MKPKTLVIAAVTVGLLWYWLTAPHFQYRYRMTVAVDVGGEIHSGSSVIEARIYTQSGFPGVVPFRNEATGEAVFVDLGRGRNVIALLASEPKALNVDYPVHLVPGLANLGYSDADLRKFAALKGLKARWDLSIEQMPTFVTLGDIADPKSARVVPANDFESALGAGVRLKSVEIELTTDAITHQIAKEMPTAIAILREDAKIFRTIGAEDPFRLSLGQLKRRQ
jgi:hypothetical protein